LVQIWEYGTLKTSSIVLHHGLQLSNGMSDVRVTDLDMRDDYKVFASTYGRGIFSSYFSSDGPLLQLSTPQPSLKIGQGETNSFKIKYRVFSNYDFETTFSLEGYLKILK
jgi:hypothetical protein